MNISKKSNNSIFKKLMASVSLIVLGFLLINSIFTYAYFGKVLKEENLKKDYQVLRESSQYLATMFQEVTTVAQNMLFDDQIQQFCLLNSPTYFDIQSIASVLTRYTSIRHVIHSVYLKTERVGVWNIFPFDSSIEVALNSLDKHDFYGYSDLVTLKYGVNEQQIISYRSNIHDINNPNEIIGDLYINIDVAQLNNFIDSWKQDDLELSLIGKKRVLIPSVSKINEDMASLCQWEDLYQKDSIELNEGTILSSSISNTPYQLITYRSNKLLQTKALPLIPFFVLTITLLISLIFIVLYQRIEILIHPIKQLSYAMNDFAHGNMHACVAINSNDEMQLLGNTFNEMVQNIDALMQKSIEDEKMKKKIKFDMMISKIHPHFIYNTLNSIIVMARKEGNQDVIEMTRALIMILQDSMSIHDDLLFDTVAKEKSVIQAYVTIQNYRYKNKIQLIFDIDKTIEHIKIAKNVLQPIVENAIFHGIVPKDGIGIITVSIRIEGNYCWIKVSDNGVGMNKELVKSLMQGSQALKQSKVNKDSVHSIALINVLERLEFLYGQSLQFNVDSVLNEGTTFSIGFDLGKDNKHEA